MTELTPVDHTGLLQIIILRQFTNKKKIICCRTRLIFSQLGYEDYSAVNIQVLGSEDTYGPHARRSIDGVSIQWSVLKLLLTSCNLSILLSFPQL